MLKWANKTSKPLEKSNTCCLQAPSSVLFPLYARHKSRFSTLLWKQPWMRGLDVFLYKSPEGLDYCFVWTGGQDINVHSALDVSARPSTVFFYLDMWTSSSDRSRKKQIPWQPNPTSFPWFTSLHFLPSIWTCTVELDEAVNWTEISPLDLVGLDVAGATPLSPCALTDVTKLGKGPQNQDRTQQPGLEQTWTVVGPAGDANCKGVRLNMHLVMCNLLFCEMVELQSLSTMTNTTGILLHHLTALSGPYVKCLHYSGTSWNTWHYYCSHTVKPVIEWND